MNTSDDGNLTRRRRRHHSDPDLVGDIHGRVIADGHGVEDSCGRYVSKGTQKRIAALSRVCIAGFVAECRIGSTAGRGRKPGYADRRIKEAGGVEARGIFANEDIAIAGGVVVTGGAADKGVVCGGVEMTSISPDESVRLRGLAAEPCGFADKDIVGSGRILITGGSSDEGIEAAGTVRAARRITEKQVILAGIVAPACISADECVVESGGVGKPGVISQEYVLGTGVAVSGVCAEVGIQGAFKARLPHPRT